jgi:PEP-CTERM motif
MRRFLPALFFTICIVPTARADSITYTATEQLTKATPTEEDFSWKFTGPQSFDVLNVLATAPDSVLAPFQKSGDWLQIQSSSDNFISGGIPAIAGREATFATYGTFGHLIERCWPSCPTNETNKFSFTFTNFPTIGFLLTDRTLIGTYPVGTGDPQPAAATPEPSVLVLFGSGLIGLIFLRKLRRPRFDENSFVDPNTAGLRSVDLQQRSMDIRQKLDRNGLGYQE